MTRGRRKLRRFTGMAIRWLPRLSRERRVLVGSCATRRRRKSVHRKRKELNGNRGPATLAQPSARTKLLRNPREDSDTASAQVVPVVVGGDGMVGRDLRHVDRCLFRGTHEMVLRADAALADARAGAKPV